MVENTCSICLEEIIEGIELKCKHLYHNECISEWINVKYNCPCCNLDLKNDERLRQTLPKREDYPHFQGMDIEEFRGIIYIINNTERREFNVTDLKNYTSDDAFYTRSLNC